MKEAVRNYVLSEFATQGLLDNDSPLKQDILLEDPAARPGCSWLWSRRYLCRRFAVASSATGEPPEEYYTNSIREPWGAVL